MTQKNNHDSYIDAAPSKFRSLLKNVRAQLSQALPDAEEITAYGVREVVPHLDRCDRPLPRPIIGGKGIGFTGIP